MADHIFMLAGEASGDKLGGMILKEMALRGYKPQVSGVGGDDMCGMGLASLFPMHELSIVGITSAITHYIPLKRRLASLVDHIRKTRPRMVLTIDSKAFSLRLGKELKAVMAKEGWQVPIVHLVAPTVWAWASWRAKNISKCVDHLLCLFPFEVGYFTKHNVPTYAVGHPAADIKFSTRAEARQALGLHDDDTVVAVFPGSRRREVMELFPDMCAAIKILQIENPRLKAILPAARSVRQTIDAYLTDDDLIEVVDEAQRYDAMRAADVGLICSGTLTLETALAGLPGHVYYRTDALTAMVARRLLDLDKLVLANAVTGDVIYDHFVQQEFNATSMAAHARHILDGKTPLKDIARSLKNALTPDDTKNKGADNFQVNVVDRISFILNGL